MNVTMLTVPHTLFVLKPCSSFGHMLLSCVLCHPTFAKDVPKKKGPAPKVVNMEDKEAVRRRVKAKPMHALPTLETASQDLN
eukprot:4762308-Amphidinium_carterae.1